MNCEYCGSGIHHELEGVVDDYDMCYHVWCYYERVLQEGTRSPEDD